MGTEAWLARLIVEVAFPSDAGAAGIMVLDEGQLDTATLSGDFFDVLPEDIEHCWVKRGVSRFDGVYARADAGRAGVTLDNSQRQFDPTNLAGPYVTAGVSEIVPMRVFRIRAEWDGVAYPLWRGFADEWKLSYERDVSTCELTGTDGTKVVANVDNNAGSLVGSGETTGARISRVLDAAGWPGSERLLDAGSTTVQSTDLASNAWSEILLTSDTELGEVYFDANNKIVFRHRNAVIEDERSQTAQAVFGDGADELPFASIEVTTDADQVRNVVTIARVGGTEHTVEDAASQGIYLRRSWGRSDLLMETDEEAALYAEYVLSFSAAAELRFASMTIDPTADPDGLWPHMLGRELGDRITVKFTPPGGGARIVRDVFIRGISHDTGPSSWVTTWAFQDPGVRQFVADAFILNSATLGKLNQNALAFY